MSYAICRIQKCKAGDVTGLQIHDQREKDHSNTNPDIDFNKRHLNENLNSSEHVMYRYVVNERIKELNLPKAVRKDATVMAQALITSDKPFFDSLSKADEKRFFEASYRFISGRYGKKNIVSAVIHRDEKTPHMHVNFVPVTKDGRLCAKEVFKPSEFHELQTDYHTFITSQGFALERGQSRDDGRRHYETAVYKTMTAEKERETTEHALAQTVQKADKTIESIEKDVNQTNQQREAIQRDLDGIRAVQKSIDSVDKVKKRLLGYNPDDIEQLRQQARAGILFYNENKELIEVGKTAADQISKLDGKVVELQHEVKKVKNVASKKELGYTDKLVKERNEGYRQGKQEVLPAFNKIKQENELFKSFIQKENLQERFEQFKEWARKMAARSLDIGR